MIIVQISDTHISVDHEDGPRRAENLECAVAAINALEPAPDLVIHTGDMVNRGKPEEYTLAQSLLAELRVPFLAVPGNRDHRDLMRACLASLGSPLPAGRFMQFSMEEYPVRLIGLDSLSGHNNKGALCEGRLSWLRDTLAQDTKKPAALFMHHPPFDIQAAKDPFQFNRREDARNLEAIIAASGQVIGLFCGHAHRAARASFGGAPATTLPSIAVSLQKGSSLDAGLRHPALELHHYRPGQRAFDTIRQACL